MTGAEFAHIPVLASEVLSFFAPVPASRMIDATLGNGGHTKLMLQQKPQLKVMGIDRDTDAIDRAKNNLADFADRVTFCQGEFSQMQAMAKENGFSSADLILMDIGVSSPQLDNPSRGFSWRMEGPLDMRMDRSSPLTASRLLNTASEKELTRIFRDYGEIPQAHRLSCAAVERRQEKPFAMTSDLVKLADDVLGKAKRSLPAPTLVFQALRIAVNDELGELERALRSAFALLLQGGRLAVITFHSLEDRMVKQTFREWARGCLCPPGLPVCVCHHESEGKILTAKPVTATEEEIRNNCRSACAKLRVIEKIGKSSSHTEQSK